MTQLEKESLIKPLYMVRDEDGNGHFYTKDPLLQKNLGTEVKIEELISDVAGSGSRMNPVLVYLQLVPLNRAEAFTPSALGKMRTSPIPMSVRDLEGSHVTILEEMNDDGVFPLNGQVRDSSGQLIADRRYALDGACSDGVGEHSLVIMYR